jgi:hypothetical protein
MMELDLLEHALVSGNGEDYMLRMLKEKRTDSENLVVKSKMILFVYYWKSVLPRCAESVFLFFGIEDRDKQS